MAGSWDRVRQTFADRFEADGDGFLYRASPTAAPVRVTPAERDGFVAAFNRGLTWIHWSMMAAIFVLIGGYMALAIGLNLEFSSIPLYLGTGVVFVAYMAAWRWLWTAPRRTLANRAIVGAARTKTEARRAALAKLTWTRMGGSALIILLAAARIFTREDVLHGWGRLWLVLFVAAALAIAFGVYRKWRFDREAGRPPAPTVQ